MSIVLLRAQRHVILVLLLALLAAAVGVARPAPARAAHPGATGLVAFARGGDIWLVQPDGSGPRNLTQTTDVGEDAPAVSPDGRSVPFESSVYGAGAAAELHVMGVDGGGRRVVVRPGGVLLGVELPAWSPDGSAIAFSGYQTVEKVHSLFIAAADGSGYFQRTSGIDASSPSWSVGDEIAFASNGEIWSVGAAPGTAPRVVAEGAPHTFADPDWSPDGSAVVFSCNLEFQACRANADGSGFRELVAYSSIGMVANLAVRHPHYAPDGTRIVFSGAAPGGSGTTLHTMPASGLQADNSGSTPLTTGPAEDTKPSWGPTAGTSGPDPDPDPQPEPQPAAGGFDGDPATTERID